MSGSDSSYPTITPKVLNTYHAMYDFRQREFLKNLEWSQTYSPPIFKGG